MKAMQKAVTLKDIASRLSVSAVTVSKALSGKEGVSDELRELIIQTAQEMGYRKNLAAKHIRSGKTNNIGILVSERHIQGEDTYTRLQQQISQELLNQNYYGIAEFITTANEEVSAHPRLLQDNKVDALIILGQMRLSYVKMALSYNLPTLFVDFFYDNQRADAIICDNLYGGYTLTSHLIQLGHTKIAFVGNPMYSTVVMDRYLGYCKALMENGIPCHPEWVLHDGDEFGSRVAIDLSSNKVSAYVCCSCESAYRVMRLLEEEGVAIPEQASVVGFDDDPYATLSSPPLTTFSVSTSAMAQSAAQSIMTKIKNPQATLGRITISGTLQVRASTARATPEEWSRLNRFG